MFVINWFKKMTIKQIMLYVIMICSFIGSVLFVYNNHSFYDRYIAKVTHTTLMETTEITDVHNNKDKLYTQRIEAVILNGEKKGQMIELTNEYSTSGAYDQQFQRGNELFVSINEAIEDSSVLTGRILNVKRDIYVVLVAWLFVFTLLIIGKRHGLFSIISFTINALLLSFALDIYVKAGNSSLLLVCGIIAILFMIISLFFVSGFHEKTYAAIITTFLGTFSSLLITFLAMWVTSENGLHYEEMQFLTRPYHLVFMAGLLIGSLGAVMDVAITMSSAIFELYEKNHAIPIHKLKQSGMEIGRDIMGTITGILFFVYVSGSIPMIILFLMNGVPLGYTLSMNLSLEIARALAGGIGVVLTIPISLYTSIYFVNRKRVRV